MKDKLGNILLLTNNIEYLNYGILSIFCQPNSIKLTFLYGLNGQNNSIFIHNQNLPKSKLTNIKLQHSNIYQNIPVFKPMYQLSIFINDTKVHSFAYDHFNNNFENVKVYMGSPWQIPADNVNIEQMKLKQFTNGKLTSFLI